jgi:hypothetical protein
MYVEMILSKFLEKSCDFMHSARRQSLLKHVQAVVAGNCLRVTHIGRAVYNNATTKSNINMANRLISNPHLQEERTAIYIALGKKLLSYSSSRPIIVVDWTSFHALKHHMIRASIIINGGRGNTLYEEMFEEKDFETRQSHERIFEVLAQMMPKGYKPIIVTDAGFRGPWFKAIQKRGWDFVGRIRNLTQYKLTTDSTWRECRKLHSLATLKPRCIGDVTLGKNHPVACKLYLYTQNSNSLPSNKTCSRCERRRCTHSKSYREPWVIATSLTSQGFKHLNKLVTMIYKKRMQIEQEFRDLKTLLAFKYTQTRDVGRLNILLLLGALANWVLWLVGFLAEHKKLHYQFQANTVRKKRVLSFIFLGLQLIRRDKIIFTARDFLALHKALPLHFLTVERL